ncbi:MAG TPA: RagB/SusD family nutrient uptake outer membrane protein [Chitinophagaceae bacterium]|nr:RagB/SusD family nutrient uptake outer membrane protein [Chitinophagaceae bacterium]
MKNNFRFILTSFVFLIATSCEKNLDIDPTQSIDEDQALLTSSDVEAALVGAYSDLGDGDVYGGSLFVLSELLGNSAASINWTGTFQTMTQVYTKLIPVDNADVRDTWTDAYKAINDVNNVLSAIDIVLEAKKNRVEGEAKFIRGSIYFDLVRLYAKAWDDGNSATNDGVPLILEPTRAPLGEEDKKPRAKVAEVYAQVIKDLTEAEALLPASNGFFASKYAAAAMLSRVYLQKGDYTDAAEAATRVIASQKFKLTPTYAEAFPFNSNNTNEVVGNTSEDVFAMQVTNSQGVNSFNTYFSTLGRGDIDIAQDFIDQFEPNDDRLSIYYDDGGIRSGKFDMVYSAVRLIRLAEMYLTRAEANFRLGTSIGDAPVDDINEIRKRADLALHGAPDLTLALILKERKLELAFEGFTLADLKRTQSSVGSLPWNSPRLVFPIPDRERKVNSNLTQNDGY